MHTAIEEQSLFEDLASAIDDFARSEHKELPYKTYSNGERKHDRSEDREKCLFVGILESLEK